MAHATETDYAPPQPIYPDWSALLRFAIAAVHHGRLAPLSALEPFMEPFMPPGRRPVVFDRNEMFKWLEIDVDSACAAMRDACGFTRMPDSAAEAVELLGPGCQSDEDLDEDCGPHFPRFAHAEAGRWSIAACGDCSHPFVRYFDEVTETEQQWPLYGDLQ